MKGLEPSLLDKLLDDAPKSGADVGIFKAVSLDEYKETVARDLEGLLNSRASFSDSQLENFQNCTRSLLTYGLCDFSSMSLANKKHREAIRESLKNAIGWHEPRLRDVKITLHADEKPGGGLRFTIHGLLEVEPAREPVSFDAVLQPTTLQYSVSRHRTREPIV